MSLISYCNISRFIPIKRRNGINTDVHRYDGDAEHGDQRMEFKKIINKDADTSSQLLPLIIATFLYLLFLCNNNWNYGCIIEYVNWRKYEKKQKATKVSQFHSLVSFFLRRTRKCNWFRVRSWHSELVKPDHVMWKGSFIDSPDTIIFTWYLLLCTNIDDCKQIGTNESMSEMIQPDGSFFFLGKLAVIWNFQWRWPATSFWVIYSNSSIPCAFKINKNMFEFGTEICLNSIILGNELKFHIEKRCD